LADSIPNLTTLVLSSNNVAELADLDPLRRFRKLTHLSLIENPVTRKEVCTRPSLVKDTADFGPALPILAHMAHTISALP
jgi:hypothetical protein